jgi:hypothetical protein
MRWSSDSDGTRKVFAEFFQNERDGSRKGIVLLMLGEEA